MELRHLRYFLAVAESGSLSSAAERLHVAQPPLGRQIRDLEHFVGSSLFLRSNKGMRLTEAGRAFLPKAQEIIASSDAAVEQARAMASGRSGRLIVGYSDEFSHGLMPAIATEFLSRHSDARLMLEMNYNADTAHAVADGRYDIGLIVAPPPSHLEGLTIRTLDKVPLHLAVAPQHRLATQDSAALSDLAGETILTARMAPTSGYYMRLMQLLRSQDVQVRLQDGIYPTEMIGHFIAAGHGVALVALDSLSAMRRDLVLLPLEGADCTLERCLVSRSATQNALAAPFIELALSIAGQRAGTSACP